MNSSGAALLSLGPPGAARTALRCSQGALGILCSFRDLLRNMVFEQALIAQQVSEVAHWHHCSPAFAGYALSCEGFQMCQSGCSGPLSCC